MNKTKKNVTYEQGSRKNYVVDTNLQILPVP